MRVRRLRAALATVYLFIFLVAGTLLNGSQTERFLVTLSAVGVVVSFLPRLTSFGTTFRDTQGYATRIRSTRAMNLTLGTALCLYLLVVLRGGVPILARNVEVARMIPVISLGPVYRVMNEMFTIAAAGCTYMYGARLARTSWWLPRLALCIVLVTSLGFRSRIIDLVALSTLAYVLPRGSLRLSLRAKATVAVSVVIAFSIVVALTSLRGATSGNALVATIDRAFLLNHRVNLPRAYAYVDELGLSFGTTFVSDMISVIVPSMSSSQQVVTAHFNRVNSNLFTMTPTVYGEFYLSFGSFTPLFILPILLLYRFGAERVMLALRPSSRPILWIAAACDLIYMVPTGIVPGGVNSTYHVRFATIIVCLIVLNIICAAGSNPTLKVRPNSTSRKLAKPYA